MYLVASKESNITSKHHGSAHWTLNKRPWKESIHPKRKQEHVQFWKIVPELQIFCNFFWGVNLDWKYFQSTCITCKNCHVTSPCYGFMACFNEHSWDCGTHDFHFQRKMNLVCVPRYDRIKLWSWITIVNERPWPRFTGSKFSHSIRVQFSTVITEYNDYFIIQSFWLSVVCWYHINQI